MRITVTFGDETGACRRCWQGATCIAAGEEHANVVIFTSCTSPSRGSARDIMLTARVGPRHHLLRAPAAAVM